MALNNTTKNPDVAEYISEDACDILKDITIFRNYETDLIRFKSIRHYINDYRMSTLKVMENINKLIQMRNTQNIPPVPEDERLYYTLAMRIHPLEESIKKLDEAISTYDAVTHEISGIRQTRQIERPAVIGQW